MNRKDSLSRLFRVEILKNVDAMSEFNSLDKVLYRQYRKGSIDPAEYLPKLKENTSRIEYLHGIYKPVNRLVEMKKEENNQYIVSQYTNSNLINWFTDKCIECADFCNINTEESKTLLFNAYHNFLDSYGYKYTNVDIDSILSNNETKDLFISVIVLATIGGVYY
jgi:CRISPR-associated protein Cas8b1/Cst1 subtype I-B